MANNKTTTPREITFRVRRFDPDKESAPHWDDYKMHVHDGMTVLEALHELKAQQELWLNCTKCFLHTDVNEGAANNAV